MINSVRLIVLVAAFITLSSNATFFGLLLQAYPLNGNNAAFILSTPVLLASVIVLLLLPFNFRLMLKPVLGLVLLGSAMLAHFMDEYGVPIDDQMVQNLIETNYAEALDLLSFELLLRVFVAAILPLVLMYRWQLPLETARRRLLASSIAALTALAIIGGSILAFGDHYASLIREHKPIRYFTNPTYPIYALGKFLTHHWRDAGAPPKLLPIGIDAAISSTDKAHELVVMIVGETARADHFALNGYEKPTNPRLRKIPNLISFTNMHSCGTATAQSLPCMFSASNRQQFDGASAADTENVLDMLQRAGVNVLWRDNNSGSKGVGARVLIEDYKSPALNPVCDPECRDIGMLDGLQDYINAQHGDTLIVLHQMGSHGPAYDNRYPEAFRVFTPVCESSELSRCSAAEITNAYDNTILYTDNFVAAAIALLQANSAKFETALLYISDHGESLGEMGVYLHGMPYLIAPDAQTHVAALMWLGDGFDASAALLARNATREVSHDNVFHTLLDVFEVEANIFAPDKSLLRDAP